MRSPIRRRAFTLLELLTVMAITAILLTIIAIPVIQSFNLTRSAQGFADAQQAARALIRQIENEIGNSAGVRDNTGLKGALTVVVPGNDGTPVRVTLPNVKIDIVRPAEGDPASRVGTAFINPDTGKVDPTLQAPKGQPNLPSAGGDTMVRYFVALRDPFGEYNNPYTQLRNTANGLWLGADAGRDNLYVLYRAEVNPYRWVNIAGTPTRVVNADFFVDSEWITSGGTTSENPLYDDPSFMDAGVAMAAYPSTPPGWTSGGAPTKQQMIRNWLRAARVVTQVSRYDMIMPIFNRGNNRVLFDGNIPQIAPLVRFQPNRVTSEPAQGQLAVRSGEETDNAEKIGPDVFRTQYGAWANLSMRIWPSQWPAAFGFGTASMGAVRNVWQTGSPVLDIGPNLAGGLSLFNGSVEVFNVSTYLDLQRRNQPYPFSRAVNAGGLFTGTNNLWFVPVVPDPRSGQVLASFDIREFGVDNAVPYDDRIPSSNPGVGPGIETGVARTPNDPFFTGVPWDDPAITTINDRFGALWNNWPTLAPNLDRAQYCTRFIDLRITPQAGVSAARGPLHPLNNVGRPSITPGSEVVVGPDQTPGPNYGRSVRYTRVTQRPVGPNQYLINYVDQPEPDWATLGFVGANYSPFFYDPAVFLSAVLQPRFRAGYIELNSRYGEPIPQGNIYVTYRFQFTEPRDVIAVDYDSAELMEVVLTIRNFPQTTIPNPQMITVRGSSSVRNFIR